MESYLLLCYTKAGLNCDVHAQVDVISFSNFQSVQKERDWNKKDLNTRSSMYSHFDQSGQHITICNKNR